MPLQRATIEHGSDASAGDLPLLLGMLLTSGYDQRSGTLQSDPTLWIWSFLQNVMKLMSW